VAPSPGDLYAAQAQQGAVAVRLARHEWRKLASVDDFAAIASRLSLIVSAGQLGAARQASQMTVDLIGPGVAEVDPAAFAGVASDGRSLSGLLYSPVPTVRGLYGSGLTDAEAMKAGEKQLALIVATQVADAWRGASGVAIAATPNAGYYRMAKAPCCQRCAVLVGKFFRWNEGFQRHPRCDCVHVPATGSPPAGYVDQITPDQVRDLNRAQRKAIADGADMRQIINAKRGRSADKMTTTEGTTRRGWASYVTRKVAAQRGEIAAETAKGVGKRGGVAHYVERRVERRLTPEAIYREATSREEAVRLLARNGYLVGDLGEVARLAA